MPTKPSPLQIWENLPVDPLHLITLSNKYLQWLKIQGYSQKTTSIQSYEIARFLHWSKEEGATHLSHLSHELVEKYNLYMTHTISQKTHKPLSVKTRRSRLLFINQMCKWLVKKGYLKESPTQNISLPKLPANLPGNILDTFEVEKIINGIDINRPLGVRDRAMIETFYSSGIRCNELRKLKLSHLDFSKGTLMIVEGKGRQDRLIPIGQRALKWIEKYLSYRKTLLHSQKEDTLFLTRKGFPFISNEGLARTITKHIKKAHLDKPISGCHSFRRSMATSMLENGASVRYIKEILGHKCLSTTEIYTKVSIQKLKEIHHSSHPSSQQESELNDLPTRLTAPNKIKILTRNSNNLSKFWLKQISTQPDDFIALGQQFLQYMEIANFSQKMIRESSYFLQYFTQWCQAKHIQKPQEVILDDIEKYQSYVYTLKNKKTQGPLSITNQRLRLECLTRFFRWLEKEKHISTNPTLEIKLPKLSQRLPSKFSPSQKSRPFCSNPT